MTETNPLRLTMLSNLAILAILLLATSVFAQTAQQPRNEKPVEIYLSTGAAFPTRDFNLAYNFGYNGSAGFGFRIVNHLRIVAKAEVQTFSVDQSYSTDSVIGGNYTALMTGADLRFYQDIEQFPFKPIVLIGGGLAYSSQAARTIGSVDYGARSQTKFFVNIGAGAGIRLSPKIIGFITGRYVRILTGGNGTEFFPINIGIIF